ncbi:MAG: hypothetical protein COT74_10045 [Bdellovibrionales bacterium CG10_big_fil_rev_8_21_14_0_10_45_34]|nr:MAG: hypothetical protein COT74_10045 [Bdellovibrionales bacterium CG10_big_fil_rev_8_21_14_0_10_45_34]
MVLFRFAFFLSFFVAPPLDAVQSVKVTTERTSAQILAVDARALDAAKSPAGSDLSHQAIWFALRIEMVRGWHVYWMNPGDSGLAPKIKMRVPSKWRVDELLYAIPERIDYGPLVNFGYSGETLYLWKAHLPSRAVANGKTIKIDADWLVCESTCLPEKGSWEISLGDVFGAEDSKSVQLISRYLSLLPILRPTWPIDIQGTEGDMLKVFVNTDRRFEKIKNVDFFADREGQIEAAAPVVWKSLPSGFLLELKKSPLLLEAPARLKGIVKVHAAKGVTTIWADSHPLDPSDRTSEITLKLENTFRDALSFQRLFYFSDGTVSWLEIFTSIIFALLGGLILNLMPCVFPILAIKVFGVFQALKKNDKEANQLRSEGLYFSIGVVSSFFVMGFALLVLRLLGESVGWGFQLQSPLFVAALALLFALMGLIFIGSLSMGDSVARLTSRFSSSHSRWGAIGSGVLAVLVATPCTAPFMGTALGTALASPPFFALLIFMGLGLGMALPFLILALRPQLLGWLPKPGSWMETFKQFLAFPLFATVVWLLWILNLQAGFSAISVWMLVSLSIWFSLWLIAKTQESKKLKWLKWAGWIAVILSLYYGFVELKKVSQVSSSNSVSGSASGSFTSSYGSLSAIKFSPDETEKLANESQLIFVDFTAAWCITCQVNKRTVFTSDEVIEYFKNNNVKLIVGDWTNANPEITEFLTRFGRSGVPLNLVYGPGLVEPLILPSILTPSIVLEALEAAKKK